MPCPFLFRHARPTACPFCCIPSQLQFPPRTIATHVVVLARNLHSALPRLSAPARRRAFPIWQVRLITQLRTRLAFVDAQVAAGTPRAPLQQSAANALELMLKQPRAMDIEDVTTSTQDINSGPWTAPARMLLAQSLPNSVKVTSDAVGSRGNDLTQHCKHHEAFYKATAWT